MREGGATVLRLRHGPDEAHETANVCPVLQHEALRGITGEFVTAAADATGADVGAASFGVTSHLHMGKKRYLLASAMIFAHRAPELHLSTDAEVLWTELHKALSQESPGIVGILTARSASQVLRLATVFALLDESTHVLAAHLQAAVATWRYSDASVRWSFGGPWLRSPARRILSALSTGPKTQTELHDLFARNREASELNDILRELQARALVVSYQEPGTNGRGKPTTVWALAPGIASGTLLSEDWT